MSEFGPLFPPTFGEDEFKKPEHTLDSVMGRFVPSGASEIDEVVSNEGSGYPTVFDHPDQFPGPVVDDETL